MTPLTDLNGCTIRQARLEDLGALVALCFAHAAFEQMPIADDGQEQRLAQWLFHSPARAWCLVAEAQGTLVGYATWSREFSTWRAAEYTHVDCLYLDPAYRGRGLGRTMMAAIAGHDGPGVASHLEWQTPAWNDRAVRFYERLGARRVAKIRFSWKPGPGDATCDEGGRSLTGIGHGGKPRSGHCGRRQTRADLRSEDQ